MIRAVVYPILLMLATCAGLTQPAATSDRSTPVQISIDETWLGFAVCETRATGWVRADVLLTDEGPQVVMHELAHVQLAAAFPSCAAFRAWRASDPANAMRSEAFAYCASVRTDARSGRLTWDNAIQMYGARLAHNYPFGLSEAEAEVEIRRFCTSEEAP